MKKGKIIAVICTVTVCALAVLTPVYFYSQSEAKQNIGTVSSQDVSSAENETEEVVHQPLAAADTAEKMPAINSDYVGNVSIPDVFSEAVVQTTDNEFYLNHDLYGEKNACGTIFADFRNVIGDNADSQSDNIILYGHNQDDGTMFGNMDLYTQDRSYWLKNPFIYFDGISESSVYVIVSSFVVNTNSDDGYVFDYNNYIDFADSGTYTFENFKKEITERSDFTTGLDIDENDKFLTLSTAAYGSEPSRHVIVARKLRDGETADNIDMTKFSVKEYNGVSMPEVKG